MKLIELITYSINDWHKQNQKSIHTLPESFGSYGHRLEAVALEWDEDDGNIEVSEDCKHGPFQVLTYHSF